MKVIPRRTWEQYQNEVEADNERHRQALANFHKREQRPGMFPSAKEALWFFCKVVLWSVAIALLLIGWLAL